MTAADAIVLTLGVAAIVWVNWYFFVAGRQAVGDAATSAVGGQQVTIVVKGGYSPSSVRLQRGRPARLLFDRQEASGCTEEVVMADFGVRRFLPAFQTTAVEFTPEAAGTFEFSCGMGMLRGTLIVA